MDHSYTPLPSSVPDLRRHQARERLEEEITELAAHINAANCDLLVLSSTIGKTAEVAVRPLAVMVRTAIAGHDMAAFGQEPTPFFSPISHGPELRRRAEQMTGANPANRAPLAIRNLELALPLK